MQRRLFGYVIGLGILWVVAIRADQLEQLPSEPLGGTYAISTEHDGFERTAVVYVPKRDVRQEHGPASGKLPLLLLLHGAGGSGLQVIENGNWGALSDQKGFLIVAPDGLPARPRRRPNLLLNPRLWNSGQLREGSPRTLVDDVEFLTFLLERVGQRIAYDEERVFVSGHSNGATMGWRFAAERADLVTGLGTVAGMYAARDATPLRPVPTLSIYGTVDPLVPLAGGTASLPWGTRTTPPVEEWLEAWAKVNRCRVEPEPQETETGLLHQRYRSTDRGPDFDVIYVTGHGHAWPGGQEKVATRFIGPSVKTLDATVALWEFFTSLK